MTGRLGVVFRSSGLTGAIEAQQCEGRGAVSLESSSGPGTGDGAACHRVLKQALNTCLAGRAGRAQDEGRRVSLDDHI